MTLRRRGLLCLPLLALAGDAHAQTKLAAPLAWYGVRVEDNAFTVEMPGVPDHRVVQDLLTALNEPLLSSTLILPGDELPLNDAQEIRERLEHQVDLVLDGGSCGIEMTTVVDLTGALPEIVRAGKGSLEPFGIAA